MRLAYLVCRKRKLTAGKTCPGSHSQKRTFLNLQQNPLLTTAGIHIPVYSATLSIANTGSAGTAIYADTTEQATVLWDSAPGIPTRMQPLWLLWTTWVSVSPQIFVDLPHGGLGYQQKELKTEK
jgi:hypothetical protein